VNFIYCNEIIGELQLKVGEDHVCDAAINFLNAL